jgi:hypothetical protein
MKTKWVASRELSASPSRTLAAVNRAGRALVSVNSKPKAIMLPTSEDTLSRDMETLDRWALAKAVEAMRADSVANGTSAFTMPKIDAEIAAVRKAHRQSRRTSRVTSACR